MRREAGKYAADRGVPVFSLTGIAELAPFVFPDLVGIEGQTRAAVFADRLRNLARNAMNQTRLLVNNPRPVAEADALAIYRAAY